MERQSALWGTGGRRVAVLIAAIALVAPLGASANSKDTGPPAGPVAPSLLQQANASPDQTFPVIVQGQDGTDPSQVAQNVASVAAHADKHLADAAQNADQAFAKAQQAAAGAQQAEVQAQSQAAAKATQAALSGTSQGKKAAAAAKQASANAAQNAAAANAAVSQAQSTDAAANGAVTQLSNQILGQQVTGQFSAISGVSASLTGAQISQLASDGNDVVSVTPDAPVQVTGPAPSPAGPAAGGPAAGGPAAGPSAAGGPGAATWTTNQLWPYASGSAQLWKTLKDPLTAKAIPTIAIVDSGIENRADFGNRLLTSVDLSSIDSSGTDGYGHGTFVAGIAADSAPGYAGANPAADLIDVKAVGSTGMGLTSDVIRACQWILDNQSRYNIRVANFSLNSDITAPFWIDPLDRAVEQLWFHGITVVVAAGNYGTTAGPSGVLYSPADDPFVITVGATDIHNSTSIATHTMAPWSSWGYTVDGFAKPELSAPGRYMIGPVSANAVLAGQHPDSVVAPGYMELSGTSFAAPVVSAAAATLLAKHPNYTPDQVKGALMLAAQQLPLVTNWSGGVGELYAYNAIGPDFAPNPNAGLDQFVKASKGRNASYTFDAASWNSAAQSGASWNSASWNSNTNGSASWNSASWNSSSWGSASWNSASWNSASWNSASWNSASWNSASWNSASLLDSAAGDFAPVASVTVPDAAAACGCPTP